MTDHFEKTAGIALTDTAVGVAGALGAHFVDPATGIAAAVAARTAVEWIRLRASRGDEALFQARLVELEEYCGRLDAQVRKIEERLRHDLHEPDLKDVVGRHAIYSDFATTVATTPSPAKREALV